MQNTYEVCGNGMPVALGPIKEPQNPHLIIFLKNPLYTSWVVFLYCLLAVSLSVSRTFPFSPLSSPRVSHPWDSESGGGDSGRKKKRLCPANSSLPAELAWGMQGDLLMWEGKEAHLPAEGKGKTKTYGTSSSVPCSCCSWGPCRKAAPRWTQCPVDV